MRLCFYFTMTKDALEKWIKELIDKDDCGDFIKAKNLDILKMTY